MTTTGPRRYSLFNQQATKKLVVVVKIDGVGDVFSSAPVLTRILYNDPGINYGGPGVTYGGFRPYVADDGSTYRDLISLDGSSLSLSQKLDPEAGKASISNITFAFIDKGGYMTRLISPGVIIDEILGKRVDVFMGYSELSYPQDYVEVFRGYVTTVDSCSGMVTMQVSDPNIKRKQQLFYTAKTTLTASATNSATTFTVADNSDFYMPITMPTGLYDPAVKTFFKIEDEWIRGQPLVGSTTVLTSAWVNPDSTTGGPGRAQRTTLAAAHASGTDVTAGVEITDSAVDMALKIMLSGWNGPWITGVTLLSLGLDPDPNPSVTTTNEIYLPAKVDAKRDYGLTVGDWITLTFSAVHSGWNNVPSYRIAGFADFDDQSNRVILIETTGFPVLYKEAATPATASFRSQFDTYPVSCGLKLTPRDVDVDRHISLKDTFLGVSAVDYDFFITDTEDSGKSFIESQIYFPVGMYSLTRQGLLSVGYTKPPLATANLQILTADDILDPGSIKPSRAVNGRSFYNEINFKFDQDDSGEFASQYDVIDSESLSLIGISQVMNVESRGLRTSVGAGTVLDRIAKAILSRFKRGMVSITIKVKWGSGNQIEVGDVVAIKDEGDLQIPDFSTGERNSGTKLYEVLERSLDIKSGNVTLKLSSLIGTNINDRYGVISPSSLVAAGSSSFAIIIQDSFGAIFPGNEKAKWTNFIGQKILVHSADFSVSGETTLLGFDGANPYKMMTSGLPFTPAAGYVIDIANYPASTDPHEAEVYKQIFSFLTPTVSIVSTGILTGFYVGAGDIGKFQVGAAVRVHNNDYSLDSGDLIVSAVNTGTRQVIVQGLVGFTTLAGHKVDLIGFPDGGGAYRYI